MGLTTEPRAPNGEERHANPTRGMMARKHELTRWK
jgi:hypothetical protein